MSGREGRLGERDADRIRNLLASRGERDSLGYFTLRNDKSIMWSPTGKACIGYRVLSGVMLGSGDPIGDPEAWPGAIHAFLGEAARHAWVPAARWRHRPGSVPGPAACPCGGVIREYRLVA
jgi:lysyl-tRNA synthetase class 2